MLKFNRKIGEGYTPFSGLTPREIPLISIKIKRSQMKMAKKLKTILATVLAAVTAFGVCACGGGNGDNGGGGGNTPEDSTKTYLDVGVFDAGLGTTYFDEMKKDFEAYYADAHFEEGKTGVVVRTRKKSTDFNPTNLKQSMKDLEPVLYFLDHGAYEDFTSEGLLADVTDVMTDKYLDEDGNLAADTGKAATQSPEDIMYEGYSEVFKKNGHYYAVPFMLSVPGLIYDADLFGESGWYFKKDGKIGAYAADLAAGNCSAGPDGKEGTSDDGLPATWGDFLTLLERIRVTCTPFTFAESPSTYQLSRLFNVFWANYEGYDDFMLNYTFKGEDSTLGEINENNFIKLLDQEGRKAAIKAFYDITANKDNYTAGSVPGGGNDNQIAEDEYIQSHRFGKRVAMFVENSYWEQEARSTFDKEKPQSVWGYGKRNFKYMPIPRFVGVDGIKDQTNTERVIPASYSESYICMSAKNANKNAEVQAKVAKLFIKFVQQRSQLAKFTANTGCIRPYNYTATKEELALCTHYAQSILKLIEEGARLAPNLAIATKRRSYTGEIGFNESNNGFGFVTEVGNTRVDNPFTYFYKQPAKSLQDAFDDMKTRLTAIMKEAGAIK